MRRRSSSRRRAAAVTIIAATVSCCCGLTAPAASANHSDYLQQVRYDQPVSLWPMQELAGPTVSDAAGGNPGTDHNASFGQDGAMAGSVSMGFDGSSSYVEAASRGLSTPSVSVEAWVKVTTGGSVFSGPEYAYAVDAFSNATEFNWRISADGVYTGLSSPLSLTDGKWHHVVGVYDAPVGPAVGQAYLYIDGGLAASRPVNSQESIYYGNYSFAGAADSWIGQNGGNKIFFGGEIEDVAVYGKALPPGRVVAHFKAAQSAASTPNADCFDESTNGQWAIQPNAPNPQFRTPNPAHTEPAGRYCALATGAQGFNGLWDRRQSAFSAATAATSDKVFYFAGHGVNCTDASGYNVLPDNQQTSIGMLFADPKENASLLLGQEHSTCLNWTAHSNLGEVFNAPQLFQKTDLVVIQACFSGRDTSVDQSIAHQVANAGAKSVVGFDGELQFPGQFGDLGPTGTQRPYGDAWAAGFWQAIGAGDTVHQAVDAGTAYESYVTNDPNDTYQSGHILIYGNPNLTVGRGKLPPDLGPRATAWATASPNSRLTRALTAFLGHRPAARVRWRRQAGPRGTEYVTAIPRVGLFILGADFTVHEAVLYPRGHHRQSVSMARARRIAAGFAARHGSPVKGLRLRRSAVAGTGGERQFAFTWQRARGRAWLPTFVTVRVTSTGVVASLARESVPVRVRLRPRVSATKARAIAQHLASPSAASTSHIDGLAVTSFRGGKQHLVWMVSVRQYAGATLAPETVIWVDAASGRAI